MDAGLTSIPTEPIWSSKIKGLSYHNEAYVLEF